jgi:NAD(P)-dependent dehydrogenase (short-subunit alcohol dehydrogenase family)
MDNPTKMTEGMRINKTGMATCSNADGMAAVPELTERVKTPGAKLDGGITEGRAYYLKEMHALGTVPPPMSVKGAAKATMELLKGNKAIALVDRMAERLAFERTGVRFYDAIIGKLDVAGGFDGGPSRGDLEHIRGEELEHAKMLKEALEQLGADPTAVTPSADLAGIEGQGLGSVLADARTTVGQCLHALLTAELADDENWVLLANLAEEMGQDDLAKRFDILVNNAGILRDRTILKTSPEEWDAVLKVHLTGTFANMQAAGHVFKKQGTGGRIINTSSSSGLLGNFGQANYGAAKIGVMALTRIGAWEFARMGVTVNAIAPTASPA